MRKRTVVMAFSVLSFVIATAGGADARERTSSGTYSNRRTSGKFERSVEVWHGQRRSTTTWSSSSGHQGKASVTTTWDQQPVKDAQPEKTGEEGAAGAAAQTQDGSVTSKTTATGANGKTVEVERKIKVH